MPLQNLESSFLMAESFKGKAESASSVFCVQITGIAPYTSSENGI